MPHYTADIAGIFEIAERPDNKGKCLRQVIGAGSQSWAPEWMPYTIIGDRNWKDYEIAADVCLSNGGWAGVMGRVNGTGTGYGCKPNGYYMTLSSDGTCSLYVSQQDDKNELGALLAAGKISNIAADQWHTLMLSFSGSAIEGFVDKIQVLSAVDSTFSEGMAGLVTGSKDKTKNIAWFDNLLIKSPKGEIPSPADFSEKVIPMYKLNVK